MGLSRLLLNAESVEHIATMAEAGDLKEVDLRISDMTKENNLHELSHDLTAANFGNVSDIATKGDVAAGIMNLVFETVGMVSVFAARSCGVKDIVLTGNLTILKRCHEKFNEFNSMGYGVNFLIPERAQFSTVIGTALGGLEVSPDGLI